MNICCPHCLVPFASDQETSWTSMACPTCGASFSLSGSDATRTYQPGVQVMGRFELLEVVGNGRFGSVWKARDTQLQRLVAVKIPRQGKLDPQETELFLRDARAAAQLRHPRIVSVHEVGREFDTVYIVSDFIDGANLSEWLSGRRLTAEESAELIVQIAEALHHAHERGVVHRDVKPGNIMMDRHGAPYVIDFGLARREVGEMTVTVEGQVLGTPAYMPPEQARGEGHRADRRSDIYSVGAILFKLLTGELPFRGDARMLLIQILDEDPPSPRKLNASVPRDLETITLKCLEKDPAKRYKTARDLADDLKRYLAGEPILARPVGYIERAWRWSKRHTAVASLSASLLLLLLAAAIIAPIVAVHQSRLRREAEQRGVALQNQIAHNLFQRATEAYDADQTGRGIALLAKAYELYDAKNPMRDSIRQMMSGWSGNVGRPLVHDDAVVAVAISPDGRTALIGGHSTKSPARLWDIATRKPIGGPLMHGDSVRAVAFSPDGRLALTGSQDQTARFWNSSTGAPVGEPLRHGAGVWCVSFSADGSMVATGGKDYKLRLWDAASGELLGEPLPHPHNVMAVAFHPNGSRLMTGCYDGTAQMWDVKLQRPIGKPLQIGSAEAAQAGKFQPVYGVTFSKDGQRVVTACANTLVQFWDAATLEQVGEPLIHEQEAYSAVFSLNGRMLLTGSFDNAAHLWNADSGLPIPGSLRHNDWVMSAAFAPDNRTVITASPDRTARIWSLERSHVLPHEGEVLSAVFSPDGRMVITGGEDKYARLWDAREHRLLAELPHDAKVTAVAFDSDSGSVFAGTETGQVRRWDVQSGKPFGKLWEVGGAVHRIEHRSGGTKVLVRYAADVGDAVQLWDLQAEKPISARLRFVPTDIEEPFVFVSSPDGNALIIKDTNATAQVWDVATGRRIGQPMQHEKRIMDAAFSDDGRRVVSGGYDQHVRVWEAGSGKPLGTPIRHGGIVRAAAFCGDGTTVISGSSNHTARMWNWQTGEALGEALQHEDEVYAVRRSPDEGVVLTVCRDGSAHLWNLEVCKPLGRPLQYEVEVNEATFNRDGSLILFMCRDGTARIYDAPQALPDNPQLIRAWARVQTGFESDEKGVLHQLSHANWQRAQAEAAKLERAK